MADIYAPYIIELVDVAAVTAYRATFPNGTTVPPNTAAALYGAPIGGQTPGGAWTPPGIYTPWTGSSEPNGHLGDATWTDSSGYTDPSGNVYPAATWAWNGYFLPAQGASGGAAVPPAVPIPQRRWIDGFEMSPDGEGPLGNMRPFITREASRTADGFGLALRSLYNFTQLHNLTDYVPGITARSSWERFYLRLRAAPSAASEIWKTSGTSSSGGGLISVLTSRQLGFYNFISSGVFPLLGISSVVLTLNVWYKIDIIVAYASTNPGAGRLRVWINGALQGDFAPNNVAGGLGQMQFHSSTTIGNTATADDFDLECDIDDWHNADVPELPPGTENLGSEDWLGGTHHQLLQPTGLGGTHAGWTGDWRIAHQNFNYSTVLTFNSTTSGATLDLTTDAAAIQKAGRFQRGVHSISIGLGSYRGANSGTLGFSMAGAAPVMSAIVQGGTSGTHQRNAILYRPAATLTPVLDPSPFRVIHVKGADVTDSGVRHLQAVMEVIGAWGPEDGATVADIPFPPQRGGIHNAPYPLTAPVLAGATAPPRGAVVMIGGTYVGNGTFTELTPPEAPCFFWLRPLTSPSGGAWWLASMIGAHNGTGENIIPLHMVYAFTDPTTGQPTLRIVGNDMQSNRSGNTFQYIMVCDPGLRFTQCGGMIHGSTVAAAANPLVDATWTPQACLVQGESSAASSARMWYKGPGHATAAAQAIEAAETASAMSFAAGIINTLTAIHFGTGDGSAAFMALRMVDGSGDLGVPYQILSYTGNGTNPRNITLTPTSGRFPLLALVVGHNGTSRFRDPSHTGTISALVGAKSADAANGIVGGAMDQISVHSNLNANGVVYDVLVIPGSPLGWNNGTFYPVRPISTKTNGWPANPTGGGGPAPPPVVGNACGSVFPIG